MPPTKINNSVTECLNSLLCCKLSGRNDILDVQSIISLSCSSGVCCRWFGSCSIAHGNDVSSSMWLLLSLLRLNFVQKSFGSAALAINQGIMLSIIRSGKCCITIVEVGPPRSGKLETKRGNHEGCEHFEAIQKIIS